LLHPTVAPSEQQNDQNNNKNKESLPTGGMRSSPSQLGGRRDGIKIIIKRDQDKGGMLRTKSKSPSAKQGRILY